MDSSQQLSPDFVTGFDLQPPGRTSAGAPSSHVRAPAVEAGASGSPGADSARSSTRTGAAADWLRTGKSPYAQAAQTSSEAPHFDRLTSIAASLPGAFALAAGVVVLMLFAREPKPRSLPTLLFTPPR
jgi:hypothetical protein